MSVMDEEDRAMVDSFVRASIIRWQEEQRRQGNFFGAPKGNPNAPPLDKSAPLDKSGPLGSMLGFAGLLMMNADAGHSARKLRQLSADLESHPDERQFLCGHADELIPTYRKIAAMTRQIVAILSCPR